MNPTSRGCLHASHRAIRAPGVRGWRQHQAGSRERGRASAQELAAGWIRTEADATVRSSRIASFAAAVGGIKMKLQVPAISAVPATLAAIAICLSLLLLPGGGASIRSSSVAPALNLVAGDAVGVVMHPVRAVTGSRPAVGVVGTPLRTRPLSGAAFRTRVAPSHRSLARAHSTRTPAVSPTRATGPTAPATPRATSAVRRGRGKAKALGHMHRHVAKVASPPSPVTAVGNGAAATTHPAHARGRSVTAAHGQSSFAPGHERDSPVAGGHGASNGRGGGK